VVRRAGARVKLSARDETVLRSLARFRAARTSDLVSFAFPRVRKDTAAARLRRLFDGGYLDVRAGDRAHESVYSLGPRGRERIAEAGGHIPRPPRGDLEHHLAIVRTWVEIACAVHGLPGARLDLALADWELRERFPGAVIVPDLLVQLASLGPDGERRGTRRIAWEIDRQTESLRVLRHKLAIYERLRASETGLFGWPDFALGLRLDGGAGRVRAVVVMLEKLWGGSQHVWRPNEHAGVLLADLLDGSRGPLTPSPYRKGSVRATSADVPGGDGAPMAGLREE
jgi:hypothetical protein